MPFIKLPVLDLATVDTEAVKMAILRIRLLLLSATYKLLPDGSAVIPQGPLNEAVVPVASRKAALPEPAKVDTIFVESMILRITLL